MERKTLSWLKPKVGPKRALQVWFFAFEYAGLVVAGLVLLGLGLAFFLYFDPEPHRHIGFEQAEVLGLVPMPSETGRQEIVLDVRLNDSSNLRLVTPSSQLTGVKDIVCLEKRIFLISGGMRYRVEPLNKCNF